MLEDGVARLVPMRVVDGLEVIDVDHGNAKAGPRTLVRGQRFIEQFQDMAAVRQSRELIGPGRRERRLMGLAQGLLVLLQGRDVGSDRQDPAIREDRVVDPEPAAIDKIGLEGLAGQAPSPGQGSGKEGLDIPVIDPNAKPVPVRVAGDVGEGEGTVVVAQEHALIGLVGVPEVVLGIEDGHGLPLSVRASTRQRRASSSRSETNLDILT